MDKKDIKPGYKTSEFWLSAIAAFVGILLASGVLTNDVTLQAAGIVSTALAAMGYDYSRGKAKE